MFAVVPGQFFRARRFPPAAVPVTVVGFLTCVGSQVCLEMRTLCIGFAAAGIVASVVAVLFRGHDLLPLFGLGSSGRQEPGSMSSW